MRTYAPKPTEIAREWYLVDAQDQTLGRFASRIAGLLMGKDKLDFAPHLDAGDFVVVVNAEKVRVTGKKLQEKLYYRHSGYPGGLRTMTLEELLKRRPTRAVRLAVKGMLPKNRLGRAMLQKLKVYEGPDHPHQAQKPKPLELA